jgi:arsenite methyltransferase
MKTKNNAGKDKVKEIVKKGYSEIASSNSCSGGGCGGGFNSRDKVAREIGYSEKEIKKLSEANLGLGCGNPTAFSKIKKGDIVVDFGSGAGFDAFIAANKIGKSGKVVGIDMTKKMIEKARLNAKKYNYKNVEFKLGDIENAPLPDNFADIIISNCVINLSPDKDKVFSEAYRILKRGGRMYISDIVLLKELNKEQRSDKNLLVGCVAGALQKSDYIDKIKKAGFKVKILDEDKGISKKQYSGIPLESLKIEGIK